jgi:flagellin
MSSILTNNGAMVALQTLQSINKNLGEVQGQISTGKKVADASDNSALWAISTVMESDANAFKAVSESLSLGSSTVAVARDASESVTELLTEMKTKIIAAQEDNVDRGKIQTDVAALREQIGAIVGAAQFNGQNLLQGTGSMDVLASLDRSENGSVTTTDISVSRVSLETTAGATVGTDQADLVADGGTFAASFTYADDAVYTLEVDGQRFQYQSEVGDDVDTVTARLTTAVTDAGIPGVTAVDTGGGVVTLTNNSGDAVGFESYANDGTGGGLADLAGIDVSSEAGANAALADIEGLINTAIDAAASFGSAEMRIETQQSFVSSLVDNLTSGVGSLVDADMEAASARLQALQVQQQLGTQALSIANQAPQSILSLFR